jgi:hypothetical protein
LSDLFRDVLYMRELSILKMRIESAPICSGIGFRI